LQISKADARAPNKPRAFCKRRAAKPTRWNSANAGQPSVGDDDEIKKRKMNDYLTELVKNGERTLKN
jgi:hypothetical protein